MCGLRVRADVTGTEQSGLEWALGDLGMGVTVDMFTLGVGPLCMNVCAVLCAHM